MRSAMGIPHFSRKYLAASARRMKRGRSGLSDVSLVNGVTFQLAPETRVFRKVMAENSENKRPKSFRNFRLRPGLLP